MGNPTLALNKIVVITCNVGIFSVTIPSFIFCFTTFIALVLTSFFSEENFQNILVNLGWWFGEIRRDINGASYTGMDHYHVWCAL